MHIDLIARPASDLALLPEAEVGAAREFIANQVAPATLRAYRTDARMFSEWCEARGVSALPASPETIATYLSALATEGAKFSTIARRCAAIKFLHETADRESPTTARLVRSTLAGIRRTIGVAQVKKAPATVGRVVEMIRLCPTTLPGLRDFWFAGIWATGMGALFVNALSGRKVVQRICRQDGKRFEA